MHDLSGDDLASHRATIGRLAWVAIATSLTSALAAILSLQGRVKPLFVLSLITDALLVAEQDKHSVLTNVPLNFAFIHSDGAYQNFKDKRSRVDFNILLFDRYENANIIHWHSSRAIRHSASTEKDELFAVDLSLRWIRDLREYYFKYCLKKYPLYFKLTIRLLWRNLTNSTQTTIPKVIHQRLKYIQEGIISST